MENIVPSVIITKSLYSSILSSTPQVPPEVGGILGIKDGVVSSYYFDDSPQALYRAAYIPNTKRLNARINQWAQEGIALFGIFHSHPTGQELLSSSDIAYIKQILHSNSISVLHFPLVFPGCKMIVYQAVLTKDGLTLHRVNIHFTEEGAL